MMVKHVRMPRQRIGRTPRHFGARRKSYVLQRFRATRAPSAVRRLTNISATFGASGRSFAYSLDSTGRRTGRSDGEKVGGQWFDVGSLSWKYDFMDQLTNAVMTDTNDPAYAAAYKYGYKYDNAGNRLRENRGQLNLKATYNPLNQLTYLDWSGKFDLYGSGSSTNVKAEGESVSYNLTLRAV